MKRINASKGNNYGILHQIIFIEPINIIFIYNPH